MKTLLKTLLLFWALIFIQYVPLAKLFILTDVFICDTRSFVTIQNFYGEKIRFRFLNYKEFLSTIEQLNFRLILKSAYYPTILGKVGPLPMKNFDKKLQLEHASQVIFKRID